ncbi:hypothetical protein CAPTEDRAFT_222810 [Capitella teleta]|uniref:Uncharacterized protein n=1 Tax=Capitella teleta TaxID=283909 RepID=R7TJJ6_CAPTE|nr:hypothetical protein CAPTEDRAFT_222810 [Capitella teleta]|eukprot:ELT93998.1 hypothetical protein CAPTEDRAFT_222810 [Capitella teleta]
MAAAMRCLVVTQCDVTRPRMAGAYMPLPCVAQPVQMGDKKKQAKLLAKPKNKTLLQRKNFLLQSFRSQLRKKQESGASKSVSSVGSAWNQDEVEEAKMTSKRLQKHQKTVDEIEEAKLDYEILGSSSEEASIDSESYSSDESEEEDEEEKRENEERRKGEERKRKEVPVKKHALVQSTPGEGWANNIEKLAMEEILRDAKRAKDMASETGVWLKPAIPSTNKRFLRNMLTSTLKAPLHLRQRPPRNDHWYMQGQSKHGEKLWEERHKRQIEHKQRKEDEWRDYRNSTYTGRKKSRVEEKIREKAQTRHREEASEQDKYERYKREQIRLQEESEKEYREMKERHLLAGNEYRYDKKWRKEEREDEEESADDLDGYLNFKDVFNKGETKKKKKKDRSNKKLHKHRKHSKRKK